MLKCLKLYIIIIMIKYLLYVMEVNMKKINQIIKNISLTLLFVMPIIIIVMKSNGLTLMNNLYIYMYT